MIEKYFALRYNAVIVMLIILAICLVALACDLIYENWRNKHK